MTVALNGNTLPTYNDEEVENFLRGSSYQLANGGIQHDNVSTTRKRRWKLTWRACTSGVKETLASAYVAILDGSGSGTFVDVNNDSYTTTIPHNRQAFTAKTLNTNPLRYDVSIILEEI